MKVIKFLILSLFLVTHIQAQKNTAEIATVKLNKALIDKDVKTLNNLLHKNLSYGHSNLWIEDKETLIQNIASNYLIYKSIIIDSMDCRRMGKQTVIRYGAQFNVILKEKEISLKLHVMQVWIKKCGKWKLLARQGVKLS